MIITPTFDEIRLKSKSRFDSIAAINFIQDPLMHLLAMYDGRMVAIRSELSFYYTSNCYYKIKRWKANQQ